MALTIREAVRKWGVEYLAICGLAKYFPIMNSESHVFFVDGTAGVGNDGVNTLGQVPDEPLLTITKALSKCTSGKNDFIFVLDYYQASGEVWPISITKKQIHIIGISGKAGPWPWVKPTGDTAAFAFASGYDTNGCEIAGFEIGAGAAHAGIETHNSGNWNIHIHHNWFGSSLGMTGKWGIRPSGGTSDFTGEMLNWLIEYNRFGTKLTEGGIEVPNTFIGPNTVKGTVIRCNHFHVNSGDKGINIAKTSADFLDGGIFDNTFELDGDADGDAVYFASGAKGSLHNNHAWTNDGVVPGENPFFDAGSTGMSFGMNFRGPGDLATDTFVGTGAIQTPTNI